MKIQVLFNVSLFAHVLISDNEHRKQCEGFVICFLYKVYNSTQTRNKAFKVKNISDVIQEITNGEFEDGIQQDASQFYTYLMATIANAYEQAETNPIHEIFKSKVKTVSSFSV